MTVPRLPEPDFWLIGSIGGLEFPDAERAEWHDQWHVEHPDRPCETPERPRNMHRPGRWERFKRTYR